MSENLDRAIEHLLQDRSPLAELDELDPEEREMLRMAQMLRGSASRDMRPEFADELHGRLFPTPVSRSGQVSRRTAFLTGLSTLAAGLVAGLGLDRLFKGASTPARRQVPLVGATGKWIPVAHVAEMTPGAIKPFTAGAVQGFLINRGGNVHALSRVCTHMACTLSFQEREQSFLCPCHGAEFDLHGNLRYGANNYKYHLPPLPPLRLRTTGERIEVWAV